VEERLGEVLRTLLSESLDKLIASSTAPSAPTSDKSSSSPTAAAIEIFKTELNDIPPSPMRSRSSAYLRQYGSVTEYASKFNRIMAKRHWSDEAKRYQFYQGLNYKIKDRLIDLEPAKTYSIGIHLP
jgi:hypothetical protein